MLKHLIAELVLSARVLLRQPGFWVPTILFPAMLYSFFGAQMADGPAGIYALASFAVYAVLGVGFYQFGVSVAQDRETPFVLWQHTLPGALWLGWAARIVVAMGVVLAAVAMVLLAGRFVGGIVPDGPETARLIAACALVSVPAVLMGIALGSAASARAAVPLSNLLFLPLAYLGGLWVPPVALPESVEALSVWTPTRAMGELAWAAVDGRALPGRYLVVLAGWSLLSVAVIGLAQSRHRRAMFG
ncbi:ABC transporter permease [Rhodobacter sp. NTK016B]|uniref:ABC transporter permease n=1 Tax=Rhodobacter sp. NTK016B TaxID=2759676 RepID=UPI001A8D3AFC|nr:ABC transporter permease [Rhodobacter sp. NTK016B]MBN8294475.1 ABC transporter permease [Rhodobacter sp. NTK016B]